MLQSLVRTIQLAGRGLRLSNSAKYLSVSSKAFSDSITRKVSGVEPVSMPMMKSAVRVCSQTLEEKFSGSRILSDARAGDDHLLVSWSDGSESKLPYVYLRDNCTCEDCYCDSSSSRLVAMYNLDVDIKPANITVADDEVTVIWSDGHKSRYSSMWLHARDFADEIRLKRLAQISPTKPKHWGNELQDKIPKFNFEQLLSCDKTLLDWITTLECIGLAIVTNTPCKVGQLAKIGERVEFLRENHYGHNFTVKAKLEPSNLAYTPSALGLHADLPYYYYTPGMQMLHCIKQVPTEGGDNQLADAFNAAHILKDHHPELFELLSTTLVDFRDIGYDKSSFFKHTRQPIIQCDQDGNIFKICYNNMTRDSIMHVPLDLVPDLYRAIKTLNSIMYEPQNHVNYKLEAGDIACFHNYRVLHGRKSWKLLKGGERHLEGGYIDWDELNSRKRVLLIELGLIEPL